jgi:hypothetical protein
MRPLTKKQVAKFVAPVVLSQEQACNTRELIEHLKLTGGRWELWQLRLDNAVVAKE